MAAMARAEVRVLVIRFGYRVNRSAAFNYSRTVKVRQFPMNGTCTRSPPSEPDNAREDEAVLIVHQIGKVAARQALKGAIRDDSGLSL
jgi:hypothetical protein